MRADRLLAILLQLQVHRRLTASALAKRLEVSPRTIYRDMEALSMAGVPVYAERGSAGGWVLAESYNVDVAGLNEAEVRALFLARPARLLADLGLHGATDTALIKLLAALPAASRRDAEHARQRIHIDVTGWQHPEDSPAILPVLQAAVWQDRRLHFTYQRGDGTAVERTVDPLGLVAKGSRWYLVAAVAGEPRTYRVSRVQAAEVLDQPCARPRGFDLAAYWADSAASFVAQLPRYSVTVRLAADALQRVFQMGRYVRIERTEPVAPDGSVTVHLVFQTEEEACRHLLGLGTQVDLVAPEELRAQVISRAASVVAYYTRRYSVAPAPIDATALPGQAQDGARRVATGHQLLVNE